MDRRDFELCSRGQDGIQFHSMIYFFNGRVCLISGYDHEGPGKDKVWEPVFFDETFRVKRAA